MPLVLKNVNLEIDAGTKIGEVFFRISKENFHAFYVKTMCKKLLLILMYFYAYIGVVGRTGAGKTTLFSAILRLTELESGQILIDDIDVSKVELKNLTQ